MKQNNAVTTNYVCVEMEPQLYDQKNEAKEIAKTPEDEKNEDNGRTAALRRKGRTRTKIQTTYKQLDDSDKTTRSQDAKIVKRTTVKRENCERRNSLHCELLNFTNSQTKTELHPV